MIRHWPFDVSAKSLPRSEGGAQVEDVSVDGGPGGLHEVEGEGVAGALVGVEDADARVEPDYRQGDAALGFE